MPFPLVLSPVLRTIIGLNVIASVPDRIPGLPWLRVIMRVLLLARDPHINVTPEASPIIMFSSPGKLKNTHRGTVRVLSARFWDLNRCTKVWQY